MLNDSYIGFSPCCLINGRSDQIEVTKNDLLGKDFFNHPKLSEMRTENTNGGWRKSCEQCRYAERTIGNSFRLGSNLRFGDLTGSVGPTNLYLSMDNACNLACRTCVPAASTTWQDIQYKSGELRSKFHLRYDHDIVTRFFDGIDLSNLTNIMLMGGEPLLGNSAQRFIEYVNSRISLSNVQLNFQTNGTFLPNAKLLDLLSKFKLVKFSISMDGISERFEYLRWPARWEKQVDNILEFRRIVPVNVMFTVEQTLSPFNLIYKDELAKFVEQEFNTNRLGDKTDYNQHTAFGIYDLGNITDEYVRYLTDNAMGEFIPVDYQENPQKIRDMLEFTAKHDIMRKQDWQAVFPDVVPFYARYL